MPHRPVSFEAALPTLLPDDDPLSERFRFWRTFLYERLTFTNAESNCHTVLHVERVLLFALLLGRSVGLPAEALEKLALCSVFHDTRRLDDDLDVGHGDRAAAYYRAFASEHRPPVDEGVARIIARHDRHDAESEARFRAEGADDRTLLLYRLFKDADALDRYRFGPEALDERYLRTDAARSLRYAARIFVLRLCGFL